jgi:hypothetical protein
MVGGIDSSCRLVTTSIKPGPSWAKEQFEIPKGGLSSLSLPGDCDRVFEINNQCIGMNAGGPIKVIGFGSGREKQTLQRSN